MFYCLNTEGSNFSTVNKFQIFYVLKIKLTFLFQKNKNTEGVYPTFAFQI